MEPRIQYAKTSDGVNIAYYAIGEGAPPLVYMTPGSHLEREWQYPEQRAWLQRLAQRYRIIRYDGRGSGLSDRDNLRLHPDLLLHDVEAVVMKVGLRRSAMFGQRDAAAVAILYACTHPEKVSHLILWCAYASTRDAIRSSPPLQALQAAATKDWHTFTEFVADLVTGWGDSNQARRYAAYIRESITEDVYRILLKHFNLDVTARLAELTMPVLVLQRREATFPTTETARRLATDIPGARLALLEGAEGVPFLGDTAAVQTTIEEFLAEPGAQRRPNGLTERELEILGLLADGASNEGIARTLSISARTVERHIGNVYLKIGAHNRAEAVAYAFRQGIAPGS